MKKISILMFCMCMGFLGWSQNLPIVDFTGFNGSNLSTISPGWSEATGASLPGGTTSTWYSDNFTNTAGPNGTAATANLWLASKRDWIVSPSFLANVNSTLEFDLALTPYGGTATTTLGSDDSIAVKISTDGGLSFSILDLWEGPGAVVSNTGQHQTYSLAGYAGTNLIVAIYVSEGTVDDAADNEVYIDNIEINNPIPVDLTVTQILSPVGSECYGTNETIQIEIQNVGTDPLDFGANSTIVQVGVLIPGPSFAIYPTVVPASVLAPGATMAVTVTNNGDFSTPGSYTIAASATFPGDPYAVNDTAVSTLFSIPTLTPPFLENFESGVAGSPGTFPFGWTTTTQTTYRWEVETDGTANSGGTGPIDDH
ncbi:MAG: choice-of-anchor J domain-containing protein, partial [Bacteroidetes bacterium]|nr:choice-of-anchor J domain-containing protein [Bacteroidota bacterium]